MAFPDVCTRFRTSLMTGTVAVIAASLALSAPALAETRSCSGTLVISPQNPSMTYLRYDFSVAKDVTWPHEYNPARRDSRARMISCVSTHWANPDMAGRPDDCLGMRGYHVSGYPFDRLEPEVTEALCNANPGAETLLLSVDLTIRGEEGCVRSGSSDRIAIVHNFPIRCTAPIGDGGSDEAYEPEPVAPISDAGGWECVGEGCDPSEEAEADTEGEGDEGEALPPTARYLPMPNFRLPGNDLYLIELSAPNWLLCRQACTDDARCGAWTYRAPTARSGPVCLIKSRAGVPIPDFCCRSGVKQ